MATKLTALNCEIRTTTGTISCKKLRSVSNAKTPAVLYGEKQPNVNLSLPQKTINLLHERHLLAGHLFQLSFDKTKQLALVKSVQTHFLKGHVIHVDLQRVVSDHKITTSVSLEFHGLDASPATKASAQVTTNITEIEITCLPKDLPEAIKVDLSKLEAEHVVHLSDIKLPKGVALTQLNDEEHNPAVVTSHSSH
jgi:large subunit ribosomal protein L25